MNKKGIYIRRVQYPVEVLGPGKRAVFWFSGCSLGCKGCMSKYLWKQKESDFMNFAKIKKICGRIGKLTEKATISGGEPFEQPQGLDYLLDELRNNNFKDIWVYSGFEFEYLIKRYDYILKKIDVLIDGRFDIEKPTDLVYRGSSNQNLILLSDFAKKNYESLLYKKREKSRIEIIEEDSNFFIVGIPFAGDWEW